jgi:hypothetical protein
LRAFYPLSSALNGPTGFEEVEHDTAELERVADEGNYQTKKNLQIGIGKIGAFTQDRRMRFEQPGRRIIQPKTDPELDKDREIRQTESSEARWARGGNLSVQSPSTSCVQVL